ncbi:ATP-binding protein [Flavobacterium sp. SUN046]|uniref:ATP-binding protein n=1 Tax=Flavobacterium sp. SUN046 TaxID=3002440 RepID=UPI002DBF78BE|nr:ATP-binding protein [Flavobacterium sp. SUN046]MEC4050118.1 ATP-binding protein [Flavobacterium sp. SUN046]
MNQSSSCFELANPNPEFLIKSIAEQGYSLETALADLMDNSITANATRIEVLTKIDEEPFTLFLSDNGEGMSKESLKRNMQFPSKSPEETRESNDLGRFGLGLKTASFSQTRAFTVLSRKKGTEFFSGLTWDVKHLKNSGNWEIIINSEEEILEILEQYNNISNDHQNSSNDFIPNTIVVWKGLYKFENFLDVKNKQDALKEEITNTTSEYLSIVFHKFMERRTNRLHIRINNTLVKPFNPFPTENSNLRALEPLQKEFGKDIVKIQGFVLPNSSIQETKENLNPWTPHNKSLMDMEGLYIYRADRLILFGGWNGLIKKMPRLQLGRLKIDIGNKVDHLFHLNVAKSQINIPHDLKNSFLRAIVDLKTEAQKEFFNHGLKTFKQRPSEHSTELFYKTATSKGVLLRINEEFPLLKSLKSSLNSKQKSELNFILKMSSNLINKVRQVDNVEITGNEEKDGISIDDIIKSINELLKYGLSKEQIKKDILPNLGIKVNAHEEISNLLN